MERMEFQICAVLPIFKRLSRVAPFYDSQLLPHLKVWLSYFLAYLALSVSRIVYNCFFVFFNFIAFVSKQKFF